MSPDKSIERYSMWLFSRYEDPQASLTEIFDLVKAKNPVSSQQFTYPEFLKLFDQWRENQRNKPLKVKMNERLAANPPTLGVMKTSTGKSEFGSTTVIVSTELREDAPDVESIAVAPKISTGAAVAAAPQRQVAEYKVVNEFILDRFIELVNEAIASGWEPLGGVTRSSSGTGGTGYYLQSLVKYSDQSGDTKAADADDEEIE
ncbi:MAG: DUF1737 domain-containing protein [Gammaproteobacteria bacterium]|nr:DUF1737 domain-containing protein [Gammaproteobacteria bacterium]